jgi:6-phosphogluconolactonase (cycloisomerase 2 family)
MTKLKLFPLLLALFANNVVASNTYLVVGAYTPANNAGLTVYRFNTQTGESEFVSENKEVPNASFFTLTKDLKKVYAVSESGNQSNVFTLNFDKSTGILTSTDQQPTLGADPCHISLDTQERFLVTANYSGGSLSLFALDPKTKTPGKALVIPFHKKSHLHCTAFAPDGKSFFATDLGRDMIYQFKLTNAPLQANSNPILKENIPIKAGSGPRHLTFHPNQQHAYLINELSGCVTAFNYDKEKLNSFQYIAADSVGAKGSADIHISEDGKFLYASNRLKADGIAIFKISKDGTLVKVGYKNTAKHPRNFTITPQGNFMLVASKDENVIEVFRIDKKTGLLHNTNKEIKIKSPVCLKLVQH